MGRFGELPINYGKLEDKKPLRIESGSKNLFGVGTEVFLQHTGLDMSQPMAVDLVMSQMPDVNPAAQIVDDNSVDVLKMDALNREQFDMRQADEIVRMLRGEIERNKAKLTSNIRVLLEKKRISTYH